MSAYRRVGILGGSFDPIHCGHLDAAAAAQRALDLTDVLVVPSHVPPHRAQPIASGYHRFAMAAFAVAGRPGWRALDVELREASRSYTADTLRRFHADGFSATELFFIVGADAFADIASWKDYPAILELAEFAVVSRPGFPVAQLPARVPSAAARMTNPGASTLPRWTSIFLIDAPTADVSSTAIRLACAHGQSLHGLVPDTVGQHIEQHGLYRTPAGSPSPAVPSTHPTAGRLHGQN
jgi:nicotinate-nucleotide adenylyltransferase